VQRRGQVRGRGWSSSFLRSAAGDQRLLDRRRRRASARSIERVHAYAEGVCDREHQVLGPQSGVGGQLLLGHCVTADLGVREVVANRTQVVALNKRAMSRIARRQSPRLGCGLPVSSEGSWR
jgi:hypothetical protein